MKVNYILDENNKVIGLQSYPFDESKPYIEIDSIDSVHLGMDKIIDGELIVDEVAFESLQKSNQRTARISDLKKHLADTDYIAIKFAEGELTADEFAPIKAQRKLWREEINTLENAK
jgi:hypothetical protein